MCTTPDYKQLRGNTDRFVSKIKLTVSGSMHTITTG